VTFQRGGKEGVLSEKKFKRMAVSLSIDDEA
jgi:hypothetical protein